jgi:WD40 repeat protein
VEGHGITALALSPNGRRLAGGAADYNLHVWNVETGEELSRYCPYGTEVHGLLLRCLAFAPDGANLLAWSFGSLELRDASTLEWHRSFGKRFCNPQSLVFAPDGQSFFTRELNEEARWEVSPSPWRLVGLSGAGGATLFVLLVTSRQRGIPLIGKDEQSEPFDTVTGNSRGAVLAGRKLARSETDRDSPR